MSKNRRSKNIFKKRTSGITLIALVVTIIVLLILAGISISMLSGNNGILTRAGDAKEGTEMAQLKEQAEMVKYSMLMDKTINGTGELSRIELVEGIASDNSFNGSKKSGFKVVTADEKYDVKVGKDLSITVTKHVDTDEKVINLTLAEVETESRAVLLKVTATVDEIETPTPDELKNELDPEETGDTPELRERVVNALNVLWSVFGASFSSWEDIEILYGVGSTPSSVFEMINGGSEYTSIYQWLIKMETIPDITFKYSNGEEITVKGGGEFVITTNGTYTVTATIENENYADYYGEDSLTISKCLNRKDNQVETYTNKAVTADTGKNSKTVTDLDGKPVEVPAGFYYGTSNNIGKVSTGFVITDSLDENGNSNGNEFVWIPVADEETDGTDNKPMAVKDGDNYKGIFYKFSGETSEVTNDISEPALVNYSDNDTSKPDGSEQTYLEQIGLDASSFESALILDYNAMIESVKTYGGFYVARYEMGVENHKMTSKIGVNPVDATGLSTSGTRYWYGLYKMAKTYTTSSVQSSMIWDSQYDAMLNFALTGEDKLKVTATNNGNHSGSRTKTGTYEGSDCINNIYDLEGNMFEWNLGCYGGYDRCSRGAIGGAANRGFDKPTYFWGTHGSRATLYIK